MKHLHIMILVIMLVAIAIIVSICLTTKENLWGSLLRLGRYPNCPLKTGTNTIEDAYCNEWTVDCCKDFKRNIDKNNCSDQGRSKDYFGHTHLRSLRNYKARHGGPWPGQSCSDRKKSCARLGSRGLDIKDRQKRKKNRPGKDPEPVCHGVVRN